MIKDVAKLWIQEGSIVGNEIDYMDDHSYDVDEQRPTHHHGKISKHRLLPL